VQDLTRFLLGALGDIGDGRERRLTRAKDEVDLGADANPGPRARILLNHRSLRDDSSLGAESGARGDVADRQSCALQDLARLPLGTPGDIGDGHERGLAGADDEVDLAADANSSTGARILLDHHSLWDDSSLGGESGARGDVTDGESCALQDLARLLLGTPRDIRDLRERRPAGADDEVDAAPNANLGAPIWILVEDRSLGSGVVAGHDVPEGEIRAFQESTRVGLGLFRDIRDDDLWRGDSALRLGEPCRGGCQAAGQDRQNMQNPSTLQWHRPSSARVQVVGPRGERLL
jgi:hypothetical protein